MELIYWPDGLTAGRITLKKLVSLLAGFLDCVYMVRKHARMPGMVEYSPFMTSFNPHNNLGVLLLSPFYE